MSEHRKLVFGWMTKVAIAVALSLGFATAAAASPSRDTESMVDTPDLAAACQPAAMQAVAAKLSIKVVVKKVANGPNYPDGTKYFAATEKVPAFCQVTGSFVTNPATGKTANFEATYAVRPGSRVRVEPVEKLTIAPPPRRFMPGMTS